jgi:ADP-ribose pyrophosphatase
VKQPGHVRNVAIKGRRELASCDEGAFLTLHRLTVESTFVDGTRGREFSWDAVLRQQIDAVVLLLVGQVDGRECVCLRSCVRPPLLLRQELDLPLDDHRRHDFLWELPAGLLEPGDRGEAGIRRRAAIEAREETGQVLEAAEFEILPGAPFACPGVIPERLHFARARVADAGAAVAPSGDGSAAEERAAVCWLPLDEGLAACERGEIDDMKTELGLRRLATRGAGRQEDAR